MGNTIYCSHHGKERLRKRCGVSKKSALRCAEIAASRGRHYTETKGSVRRWLDDHIRDEDRQIYIYGDKAYIFSDSMVLVTVLQMPGDLVRQSNYQRAKASKSNARCMSAA